MSNNIYYIIYHNICKAQKANKINYKPKSNIHCHHIKPVHAGGTDDEENLTYLSVREHIIAHFLLWKIYRNPNDLRSMKMLGANLTSRQRQIIGEFCRDNKLGFHAEKWDDHRTEWGKRAMKTQKEEYENTGKKNFYYWSTEEGRRERASIAGKAGVESQKKEYENTGKKNFAYWASPEGRLERASLGGKATLGNKVMHHPDRSETYYTRVKPLEVENKLKEGWVFGASPETVKLNLKHGGQKGSKMMHDPITKQRKRIRPDKIDTMIEAGWVIGKPTP